MMSQKSGAAIRRARLAAGLTQVQLARRTHLPQSQISAMETGRDARLSTLERVARALRITLPELLSDGQKRA
jgi:transcriptional regulator with XRE-family HTH domain